MTWQSLTLRLLLIVYLLVFIITPLLLSVDCVQRTKPASWRISLNRTGLGTEEGESAQKKSRWMSLKVWGHFLEFPRTLVLGGISRGGPKEVRFGKVGKQGYG